MKYLLMIYSDEVADEAKSASQKQAEMQGYFSFTDEVRKANVYRAGEALHSTSTATTVRVRAGKIGATDGPFAETKEQLGGFYLLECENLDEAIQWAAKIPHASQGCIEIRPVVDFSQTAAA
jgi:hypothetical protein